MNARFVPGTMTLLALTFTTSLFAGNDAQISAIEALGRLNGAALNCGQIEETRRIKRALVDTLPKQRELGQRFEDATNASFLAIIAEKTACPEPVDLKTVIDQGIEELKAAFSQ